MTLPRLKRKREIVAADVLTLSLCERGANGFSVVYKSKDAGKVCVAVSKAELDKGELLAVAYAPDKLDSQNDYAGPDAVKQMAYTFAKNGHKLDLQHDGVIIDRSQAYVAESFIVQKNDTRFHNFKTYDGLAADLTGAWAVVIKVDDPALREKYKTMTWQGVSIFGPAKVIEKQDKKDKKMEPKDLELLGNAIAKSLEPIANTVVSLQKQISAIERASLLANVPQDVLAKADIKADDSADVIGLKIQLAKTQVEATKAEAKKSDKSDPKAVTRPIFKGDLTDPEAVRLFGYEIQVHEIVAKADKTDAASVLEAQQALAELAAGSPELHAKYVEKQKANSTAAKASGNQAIVAAKTEGGQATEMTKFLLERRNHGAPTKVAV